MWWPEPKFLIVQNVRRGEPLVECCQTLGGDPRRLLCAEEFLPFVKTLLWLTHPCPLDRSPSNPGKCEDGEEWIVSEFF